MDPFQREIAILERRYRRLIRFDRILSLLYCISAALPAYSLIKSSYAREFHLMGTIAILAVGVSGWSVNTKLLAGTLPSERKAYIVTGAFVLSRALIGLWGMYLTLVQIMKTLDLPLLREAVVNAALEFIFAPPVFAFLFIVSIYRSVYHVSVHFLLKINSVRQSQTERPSHADAPHAPPR